MDKNQIELFGNFCYDESLTYEALIAAEDVLIGELDALLQRAGAEHIDFTPLGDSLMLQCEFAAYKLYVFRKVAMEIAALLPEGVTGRLLSLHYDLSSMHAFWLRPGAWVEQDAVLASEPPEGAPLHTVALARPQDAGGTTDAEEEPAES